ncbi:hypothetical protein BAUCODRAFT_151429 [Baudoinia panamericana UAMH 10762]|uniref:Mediator complex subunit 11 n=1 Tax=Baudoinia panamericana (strain UAMH 10762) TaxID=717646 RepID=M2MNP0_BAUPA|nr:uncharacterized protein BAUCODRAFT_151429 [Baudoinia panamericana UAMH 10762]EMC93058.1 hypothetical protein BAUCODRAFT_151429 [Baudoinia panamericana UAMH 10762]
MSSETWNEQQYHDALAHLERLQQQLDGLRSVLPTIVAPLLQKDASQGGMFASVKKAALQSTDDLDRFRKEWSSDQTQQLLTRSNESVKEDGDLSRAADISKYGWAQD